MGADGFHYGGYASSPSATGALSTGFNLDARPDNFGPYNASPVDAVPYIAQNAMNSPRPYQPVPQGQGSQANNIDALPTHQPVLQGQNGQANNNDAMALVQYVAPAEPPKKLRSRWIAEDLATLAQLVVDHPDMSNKDMGEILGKSANAVYLQKSRKYRGKFNSGFNNPHKSDKERKLRKQLENSGAV